MTHRSATKLYRAALREWQRGITAGLAPDQTVHRPPSAVLDIAFLAAYEHAGQLRTSNPGANSLVVDGPLPVETWALVLAEAQRP